MGVSSSSNYITYTHYQPICSGPMPESEEKDLLQVNMWDNVVNELTNFCMGTPFFRPRRTRVGSLGPNIPHWSPLCRCRQKHLNRSGKWSDIGGPKLRCYRGNQRQELADYCTSHCTCVSMSDRRYHGLQLDATGKVANLPPDIQRLVPKPNPSLFNCFGGCVAPENCRTNSLDTDCETSVCKAEPIPGVTGAWYGGTCVAISSLAYTVKKHTRPKGLNGKRSEAEHCYCNATYVSEACCGTLDGIVWEDEVNAFRLALRDDEHVIGDEFEDP